MAGAIDQVFLVSAVLVGLAFLATIALPERPLKGRAGLAPRAEKLEVSATD